MEITSYSILDLFTGIILIGTSIAIFCLGKKSISAQLFAFLSFITGIWSCLIAVAVSLTNLHYMQLLTEYNHFLGTLIASVFFLFSLSYPYDAKINKKILTTLIVIELIFIYLLFFTNTIILQIFTLPDLKYLGWTYGQLGLLFNLYFIIPWLFGIRLLFRKFRSSTDLTVRQNLRLMLIALIIGIIPPTIITILLPQIGIFDYYWLSPTSALLWIPLIAYSITRHHLFNIKVIAVELITFSLWIFILIRILFAVTFREALIEGSLLVITVIFGVILIRSVLREIRQREQIEGLAANLERAYVNVKDLNEHLEEKVAEQTKEIKKSYEVEKRARHELEELDKTKNELITAAQHNLRTPLTALRWQLENMRKSISNSGNGGGDNGLHQAITESEESVERLTRVLEDFLSITEVRVGREI